MNYSFVRRKTKGGRPIINLIGEQFNKLTVVSRYGNQSPVYYVCLCECGKMCVVRANHLKDGTTLSCGCYFNKNNILRKHGLYYKYESLFNVWQKMKDRCYNKSCNSYKNYGGRGIAVCDEWRRNAQNFVVWGIKNGYRKGLTLDRIDNNGNYEPDNCRWATDKQQSRNRRTCRYFTINGETHCLSEWCEIYNINYWKVRGRLKRDWDIEKALTL